METVHPVLQWIAALLLVVGSSFCLVGAIGLLRFDDFFKRLHAPTKATTLGVGGLLLGSVAWHAGLGQLALRELLVTLFLFVTAPVSAHLMAQGALKLWGPPREASPDAAGGPPPAPPPAGEA